MLYPTPTLPFGTDIDMLVPLIISGSDEAMFIIDDFMYPYSDTCIVVVREYVAM
ncbi:hypothetical protein D1872_339640 [compost metagenome]